MKKYKYILLTLLSSLCVSCIQPFDLKLDDDPAIFLEAFPGVEDVVVFKILPAYSYSNSAVKPELNPEIIFMVNGERVPVVLNKDYCMGEEYDPTCYIADYKPMPGDRMSVEVSSEGFPTIYAETSIPDVFPERKIDFQVISTGKEKYGIVSVSFEDDEETDLSYGLQIYNETVRTYPDTVAVFYDEYAGSQIIEEYDIYVPGLDGMCISFNGWSVNSSYYDIAAWNDDSFNGKEKTLSMPVDRYYYGEDYTEDSFYVHEEEREIWGEDGPTGEYYTELQRNKLVMYTMSHEFHKYVIANELKYANTEVFAGIAPSNFCYSNVENGYGAFAGIYRVESEWITKEFIEENR